MPFDYRDIAETDAKRIRAELIKAFNDTSAGRETGRHEVSHTGSTVAKTEQTKRKKSARQLLAELQKIIEDGKLTAEIINHVIASKSDAQIADMVTQIESKTGLTLQEYAAGILGADDALRRPGESEADYNRRIVSAVAAEIIDPARGRIKKQYQDDPLAQIIMADEAYRDLMEQVELINRNDADADRLVRKFADAGYVEAEAAGQVVENDANKVKLRAGQDGQSDKFAHSESRVSESQGFFDSSELNSASTVKLSR